MAAIARVVLPADYDDTVSEQLWVYHVVFEVNILVIVHVDDSALLRVDSRLEDKAVSVAIGARRPERYAEVVIFRELLREVHFELDKIC